MLNQGKPSFIHRGFPYIIPLLPDFFAAKGSGDTSEPEDERIDGLDLAVFVGNWLEGL